MLGQVRSRLRRVCGLEYRFDCIEKCGQASWLSSCHGIEQLEKSEGKGRNVSVFVCIIYTLLQIRLVLVLSYLL
jgi:hypothetical protein